MAGASVEQGLPAQRGQHGCARGELALLVLGRAAAVRAEPLHPYRPRPFAPGDTESRGRTPPLAVDRGGRESRGLQRQGDGADGLVTLPHGRNGGGIWGAGVGEAGGSAPGRRTRPGPRRHAPPAAGTRPDRRRWRRRNHPAAPRPPQQSCLKRRALNSEEGPDRTGETGRGRMGGVRAAVASRRWAPQGFSRTIFPVGIS